MKDLTLVCQDWGGLTGLSVVKDAPDRFSNLVIMNTGVPSPVFDFRGEENGRQDLSTGKVLIGVITNYIVLHQQNSNFQFFFFQVSSFHSVEVIQFVNGNSPSC